MPRAASAPPRNRVGHHHHGPRAFPGAVQRRRRRGEALVSNRFCTEDGPLRSLGAGRRSGTGSSLDRFGFGFDFGPDEDDDDGNDDVGAPWTWSYAGEGGKHAVFERAPARSTSRRRCGSPQQQERRHCRRRRRRPAPVLLRVRKLDLALSEGAAEAAPPPPPNLPAGTEGKERGGGGGGATASHPFGPDGGFSGEGRPCCRGPEPLLSRRYSDAPRAVVELSRPFLGRLRSEALASGRIPAPRLPDWTAAGEDAGDSGERGRRDRLPSGRREAPPLTAPVGQLLADYRFLGPPWPGPRAGRRGEEGGAGGPPEPRAPAPALAVVAVEVKPKAGHAARSPLVRPGRGAKHARTRFSILQELWSGGIVAKGWDPSGREEGRGGGGPREVSRYDPADLFSGDRDRIVRALEALFRTPQNNCRLYVDGAERPLGPEGSGAGAPSWPSPSAPSWRSEVDGSLLGSPAGERGEEGAGPPPPPGLVQRVCAEILLREPFLGQLAGLQRLDLVLDADGAVAVYRRLLRLCGGSPEAAEALVDADRGCWNSLAGPFAPDAPLRPPPHPLLACSPFPPPSDASRILSLCELVRQTSECLDQPGDDNPVGGKGRLAARLQDLHERALGVVDEMDSDDCAYLLRSWLLALSASDLSFFITLRRSGGDESDDDDDAEAEAQAEVDGASPGARAIFAPLDVKVTSLQTESGPGKAVIRWSGGGSGDRSGSRNGPRRAVVVRYRIKVIDFEAKPARKLRDRDAKEAPFSSVAV